MEKYKKPQSPLPTDLSGFALNEIGKMLRDRIISSEANYFAENRKWSLGTEQRIIAEINILSAHYTAHLMLSAI